MAGAISDSSTLIHLSTIGRLGLLQEFYGQVLVPPAVWREVVEEGQGRAGSREVVEADRSQWLKIVAPANTDLVNSLKHHLDDGEAEAIALAVEQQAEILLVDESAARRMADVFKLHKTGVIGLLIRAKRQGKLGSLRGELDCLRRDAGFRISDGLFRRALQAVDEALE